MFGVITSVGDVDYKSVKKRIIEQVKRYKKNECRWVLGACFGCGETGHRISECKKEEVLKCYWCGMTGHIASGCRNNRTNVICSNCGQNGHYARMCREQHAKCTECGVDAHIARVCRKNGLGHQDVLETIQSEGSNG
ncbi:uncharacterized protein [Palaemon carinicauda]|uniref:uncharacterized protein n=1 Tax=Palaemon carinicauda TaxID=392227 RepID=UPI0035B63E2A